MKRYPTVAGKYIDQYLCTFCDKLLSYRDECAFYCRDRIPIINIEEGPTIQVNGKIRKQTTALVSCEEHLSDDCIESIIQEEEARLSGILSIHVQEGGTVKIDTTTDVRSMDIISAPSEYHEKDAVQLLEMTCGCKILAVLQEHFYRRVSNHLYWDISALEKAYIGPASLIVNCRSASNLMCSVQKNVDH